MYGSAPTRATPRRHAVLHLVQPAPQSAVLGVSAHDGLVTAHRHERSPKLLVEMNNRRKLVTVLGIAALLSRTTFAQDKKPPALIGWLNPSSPKTRGYALPAFREGMMAHGWREGEHFVIEERWADGRMDRIPTLAEELMTKMPAVIVVTTTTVVAILAKMAPRVPIVQASGGGDLVQTGLAKSLARPGGMVTGLTNISNELSGKRVELLMETVPKMRQVGVLADPSTPEALVGLQPALARYSIKPLVAYARQEAEIEPALVRLAKDGAQALILLANPWFNSKRDHILRLALAQRWPVVATQQEFAEAGALLSYGADIRAQYRRAAFFVDRILKGTRPGDLPIEQPTTFDLVVNLKTAKALGLTIPSTILVRATHVIE